MTVLIASSVGVAYADGTFPGKNTFGETTGNNTNIAFGYNSAAFGKLTEARGYGSTAFGYATVVTGVNAVAFGHQSSAGGDNSIAVGANSSAGGDNSIAVGANSSAGGDNSIAVGVNTRTVYENSAAFGQTTEAAGYNSVAFGRYIVAQPYNSFVIGQYNDVPQAGSAISWIPTDPLFIIANGESPSNRNNAVTVLKNGNVGIGVLNPTQPLQVNGIIQSTSGGFIFPDGSIQTVGIDIETITILQDIIVDQQNSIEQIKTVICPDNPQLPICS